MMDKDFYIQPRDIVNRLLYSKRHWFHGEPTISVSGKNGSFGELVFDFKDEIVSYTVYLKDKHKILLMAQNAIKNFSKIANQIYKDSY